MAKANGVPPSNFKQLVGLNKNSSPGLPEQKGGWRLRQNVWWLERTEVTVTGQILPAIVALPFAGKTGADWVQLFRAVHCDDGLDGQTMYHLAHTGMVWADGKRSTNYCGCRKLLVRGSGEGWANDFSTPFQKGIAETIY